MKGSVLTAIAAVAAVAVGGVIFATTHDSGRKDAIGATAPITVTITANGTNPPNQTTGSFFYLFKVTIPRKSRIAPFLRRSLGTSSATRGSGRNRLRASGVQPAKTPSERLG